MYLDAACIVKVYLNEAGSDAVRVLVRRADSRLSSMLSIAEVNCVFHRRMREGSLTREQCLERVALFEEHVRTGVWKLTAISPALLKRTGRLIIAAPKNLFLRAGDAIHLLTAQELGESEIWTGDRHMLAAAPYFGLIGRSV